MRITRANTLALAAAVTAALLAAGCSAQGSAQEDGTRLLLFFDMSASVDGEQRRIWSESALRLVDALRGGWGVAIYPIHDQTMSAAPLFEAEIPVKDPDAGSEEAQARHAALLRARKGAAAAVRTALETGGGATRTDVFSAIDRMRPDPRARRMVAVFFSDMLNSTADLNLEAPGSLTRETAAAQVERVARRHHWQPGQLANVEVYCVLNAVASGQRGPAVDRLTQRCFYDALFSSLGARLAVYDTTLGGDLVSPVKGAGHGVR
jgi:hypothetical protein